MTRRVTVIVASLFLSLAIQMQAAAPRSGMWSATQRGRDLHLNLYEGGRRGGQHGFSVPIALLTGLDEQQIASPALTNVAFSLRRAAGTIEFTGSFEASKGSGHYTFTPSETFVREMRELGYTDFSDSTLFLYTTTGFTPAWIRELHSMGYRPARKDLDEIAIFRVTPDFVREMASAGFPKLSFHDLVQLRIGNVDADRVREYKALGFTSLSASSVANLGIMQVTPAYIREMADAGYKGLTASQYTNLRIGQISAEDVRAYRSLGYDDIPAGQLGDMGIHGVTPTFIRDLAKAGYRDLSVAKLIEMKIFGVTPQFIESLREAGYLNIPVQKLIQLRMSKADEMLLNPKKKDD